MSPTSLSPSDGLPNWYFNLIFNWLSNALIWLAERLTIDKNFRPGSHLCASFEREGQIAVDTCQVGLGREKKSLTVAPYSGLWKSTFFYNFDQSGGKFSGLVESTKKLVVEKISRPGNFLLNCRFIRFPYYGPIKPLILVF